jgi:DNA-binding SARP family transcriptional activator
MTGNPDGAWRDIARRPGTQDATDWTAPASRCVTLSVIGDFELDYNDQVVGVAPTTQRLICFLAFQRRPVRRPFVSGTLWYDANEPRANASLRSAIWRSPAFDGTTLIGSSNTHVWLNPALGVDLDDALSHADGVLRTPSLDPTTIDLDSELRCFSSDLLVGWYDDWVISERERFRQLRLHALDHLGELYLRGHRYSEAVQVALASVASEPLRESAQRLLVRAHLCEGNLAEALRQYRSYARLLGAELKARPSAEMEGLIADALAARSPGSWARAAPIPVWSRAPG